PGQVHRQRNAFGRHDARRISRFKPADVMMAVRRIPANARARRDQQAQLRQREIASANEQHGTGLQIEKYRQESHPTLAPPTFGVDWNYFLYISDFTVAKRKLFLLYCTATIEFPPSAAKGQRCIFSTNKHPLIDRLCLTVRRRRKSGTCPPLWVGPGPAWITSTLSRRKAFTFSARPLRG